MKWTNAALRKRLGEAGFLETDIPVMSSKMDYTATVWDRNGYQIVLHEHRDMIHEAFITERNTGRDLNPNNIGVRNVNTQGRG